MLSSYWNVAGVLPRYPPLDRDTDVDVVVIGGGLTGLTAAYLIKRAGRRVALLERGRLASIDTASTTAHLSCVIDLPMSSLIKSFGADHARAVWDAGLAAIAQIAEIVDGASIDTRFAWVRGYLHAPVSAPEHQDWHWLEREAQAAADLGFDVRFVERAPLVNRPAVEIDHQARFHPAPYLRRLAAAIDGDGSAIYEDTPVQAVEGDPIVVVAGHHRIKADYLVLATHTPMTGKSAFLSATLLQSKLALYTSYAVAGRVASGRVPDALFWDTGDPYRYLRIDRGDDYDQVIYGGEDHKTGQATDGASRLAALESALIRFAPDIILTHRWAGQVVETDDGLPYIGETSPRQFVATGFSGNGMTFGTLAAMMARDRVIGASNPWAELFDAGRGSRLAPTGDVLPGPAGTALRPAAVSAGKAT